MRPQAWPAAIVRMVEPAGIGDLADCLPETRPRAGFVGKNTAGPVRKGRPETGETAETLPECRRTSEQGIGAPRVVIQRFVQHPLAHTARGENDLRRLCDPDQPAQHDGCRPYRLDASRGNRRKLGERLIALARQQPREVGKRQGIDPVAVDHPDCPVLLRHMHFRQRPPRAADGIERLARGPGEPVDGAQRFLDQRADGFALPHGLVETQRPQRQRRHFADLLAVDPDKLQTAAAQIADNSLCLGKTGHDAVGGKPRFVLAAQHPDLEAEPALQRFDKGGPVRRLAHRCGRKSRQTVDLHGRGRTDEPAEILVGLDQSFRIEPAAGLHAAAQSAHHLLVENRRRRARRALEHHQADGVRSDIDDRDPCSEIVRGAGRRAAEALSDRQDGDVSGHRSFGETGRHSGPSPHPRPGRDRLIGGRFPLPRNALPRPERLGLVMK